jgi:hypothetical protein
MSSGDESADHAGIVALAHKYLEAMFVLQWYFNVETVSEIDLPQQIAIVVGLERHDEFSAETFTG